MIDHDLSIHFVRYGLFVACMLAMCAGVLVVRWTPDPAVLRSRLKFTSTLFCPISIVLGAVAFFAVAPEAGAWVALLFLSYCGGTLIEICESNPAQAKAAIKAFFVACGRQWGKVPSSH